MNFEKRFESLRKKLESDREKGIKHTSFEIISSINDIMPISYTFIELDEQKRLAEKCEELLCFDDEGHIRNLYSYIKSQGNIHSCYLFFLYWKNSEYRV